MRRTAFGLTLALMLISACSKDPSPTSVSSDQIDIGSTTGPRDTSHSSDTTLATTVATIDPDGDPFDWQDFGTDTPVQTGHLTVPIDYDNPSLGSFDLFVARHLADPDQRIGSLLVNPGGPGFGGSDFAIYAEQIYTSDLLERFDIVGWDPRGTGLTEPFIDCTDDYDHFFTGTDITPDDDAERQQIIDLAAEFAEACAHNSGEILSHVGTNNSARDMNSIREALGEEKISYFGFSYGSELGATWATMFPDTVRAAVLDGASDPTAGFVESGLQQAAGFENTLATFLAGCSNDPDCAFHNDGDAEGAFDELMNSLDEEPIPSVEGRPDVTRGVALAGVAQAMYSQGYWPMLEIALSNAQYGDGEGLLELFDSYYQRRDDGTYDNSLEAFQVIYCMDDEERLTVEEDDATAPDFQRVAPRFSPGTTGTYFCTFFPVSTDPRMEITGEGAGPILVMGTTGDPATPLSSTESMAEALEDGRLVVVTADQHTGYGVNQCSEDVVDRYLIDPVANAPADGTVCD
jgi:pimeloyl-ACP methyl ester carboxylesterase